MIGRIAGTLLAKQPPQLLIDAHGVGYEVEVPMSTLYGLPGIGSQVALLTHLVVREDAQLLYGFATEAERGAFRQLIKVSGVGPRIALAVLSGLSVDELSQAVSLQSPEPLTRIPGIGKKTAERLVLELRGRLAEALPAAGGKAAVQSTSTEVVHALLALGYSEKEATATARLLPADLSVEEGIRRALKSLAGA